MANKNYRKLQRHFRAQQPQEAADAKVMADTQSQPVQPAEPAAPERVVARVQEVDNDLQAIIKVVGIGGGGNNAVNSMVDSDLEGVTFIVANTDAQALKTSPVTEAIQLGRKVTKGLGAGSNPDVGRRAAEEDIDTIINYIADADILFLTAGMGGGTGTGATPVIAKAARELGILTVAVVTKPFLFEGRRRAKQADQAIEDLRLEVDTLIVIPNQKLIDLADPNISVLDAFAMANNVLKQAIKGVADIIVKPGHINVDFADVKSIMKGMGMALMGTGRASGEGRAHKAALEAISSPIIENVAIEGAKGVLINISGNSNLGLHEIHEAANVIYDKASDDANIILGSVIDESMGDDIAVTIIATGFEMAKDASGEVSMASLTAAPVQQQIAAVAPPKEAKPESSEVEVSASQEIDLDDIDTPTFLRRRAEAEKQF